MLIPTPYHPPPLFIHPPRVIKIALGSFVVVFFVVVFLAGLAVVVFVVVVVVVVVMGTHAFAQSHSSGSTQFCSS